MNITMEIEGIASAIYREQCDFPYCHFSTSRMTILINIVSFNANGGLSCSHKEVSARQSARTCGPSEHTRFKHRAFHHASRGIIRRKRGENTQVTFLPELFGGRDLLGPARVGVDRCRADVRVAQPKLDKIERHARLQCADTNPVTKTARTGGPSYHACFKHRAFHYAPSGDTRHGPRAAGSRSRDCSEALSS